MDVSAEAVGLAALNLGRRLEVAQAEGLAAYLELLLKWNRSTNLVGKRDWRDIFTDLVADSWHLADFLTDILADNLAGLEPCRHAGQTDGIARAGSIKRPDDIAQADGIARSDAGGPLVFDLGAGAGLPGIPLRLFWEQGDYYLIEPRRKRAAFLETAVATLGLARTHVFEGRVEDIRAKSLAGGRLADLVVSRAFLPWREYALLARPLVRPGGQVVAMASHGPPAPGEIPPGFLPGPSLAYPSPGGERYLWSLTRQDAPEGPA